jgi:hypothetical protein
MSVTAGPSARAEALGRDDNREGDNVLARCPQRPRDSKKQVPRLLGRCGDLVARDDSTEQGRRALRMIKQQQVSPLGLKPSVGMTTGNKLQHPDFRKRVYGSLCIRAWLQPCRSAVNKELGL